MRSIFFEEATEIKYKSKKCAFTLLKFPEQNSLHNQEPVIFSKSSYQAKEEK